MLKRFTPRLSSRRTLLKFRLCSVVSRLNSQSSEILKFERRAVMIGSRCFSFSIVGVPPPK